VLPAKGGDIGALQLESVEIEDPVFGEVQVRIHAIGLNFADVFTGLGLYSPVASGEIRGRFVPGLEFSGVVEKIGDEKNTRCPDTLSGEEQIKHGHQLVELSESVWNLARKAAKTLQVGDKVMGAARFGAYSTRINALAHQLRKVPPNWTMSQAAAFPVQTLTAYYALRELGNLKERKVVLIHSMAGGCGMQAAELCHRVGAFVIGTVGSDEKVKTLLDRFPFLDRRQLIVRADSKSAFQVQLEDSLNYLRSCRDTNVRKLDIVLDAVMGIYFDVGFKMLNPTGRYIVYGAASMTAHTDSLGVIDWIKLAYKWLCRPYVDAMDLITTNKSLMGFNLIHCLNDAETLVQLFEELEELDLPPPSVGVELKFHQLVHALRLFRSGSTTGKVVLTV